MMHDNRNPVDIGEIGEKSEGIEDSFENRHLLQRQMPLVIDVRLLMLELQLK